MQTVPPASVIVCSRNRPQLLVETIESILSGEEVPAEIVIVDQSDSANDALAARRHERGCEIQYMWTRSRGVSCARNAGASAARNDILVFTDDDVLVARTWFGAIVRALLAAGERAVVTGRVLASDEGVVGGFAPALVESESPEVYEGRIQRDVVEAGNLAVLRSCVEDVGGFDVRLGPGTAFPAGEDNDFGYRFLSAGYRIHYVPSAVVYHRAWRTPQQLLPLKWNYGVGQGAYYAKHMSFRDRYMIGRLKRLIFLHLRLSVLRLRREPRPAAGHVVYVAGVLTGIAKWYRISSREGDTTLLQRNARPGNMLPAPNLNEPLDRLRTDRSLPADRAQRSRT